ncbi:uncharacterized protein EAF01_011075 [Botrytis porri]|uniref:Cell surface spherulin 4-like protein n=1 Tax=Botrytis porri TaxID=87229 RepID=A0A4Z1KRH7_9HELO|nr:uncharacterized protein EAF01_011075 [Botrytis porri]KAF7887921.1 hypothetical protein EAF01_011075 [Botrytis porri]TGO87712.1 hypothetical protein BPOR_0209g00200 [Botrytis porri]
MLPISILLPLYIYPLPFAWNWLLTTIPLYPSITYTLVINPSTGPGAFNSFPDSVYIDAIASLNAFDNVKLLGYVDTAYMHRSVEDVLAEVETYNHWQANPSKNIHMHGIFFDDCVSNWNSSTAQFMSAIATFTHQANLSVTFNPGVLADPAFFSLADNILMIEDTYNNSEALPSIESIPPDKRSKSSVIFHQFPGSAADQSIFVGEILKKGIDSLYITTKDYISPSDLWTQFLAAVSADTSFS